MALNPALLALGALLLQQAQPPAAPWTKEDATSEFREIVLGKVAPGVDPSRRSAALAQWRERVAASGLDLGEHSYLSSIAAFIERQPGDSGRDIMAYLETHERFPTSDYDDLVVKILVTSTHRALLDRDFAFAERTIATASSLGADPRATYASLGIALRRTDDKDHHRLLNKLLAMVLGDPRLDDAGKQAAIRGIYQVAQARPAAPRGAQFKPFEAKDIDGNAVSIEAYRGKVLLVDYWATWCQPCLVEMPNVVAAYEKYKDRGFAVLGVSLDHPNSLDRLRSVMRKMRITWPQVYEGKGWQSSIAQLNQVRSIPATFLLDRKGTLRATNLRGRALDEKVAQLLAEPE